jgi:pSer/pThr/pTyr-binding forkhead associated (FHA) protein
MIECPGCGSRVQPDTPICSECGARLFPDAPLRTEPLPDEELPTFQADPWSRTVDGYEDAELPPATTTLTLTAHKTGRQMSFPLPTEEVGLGRSDAAYGVYPDLDLAPDGGHVAGVSRHHAKIIQLGNRLFVEDLGSANGTFLNEERITPHLLYALREGDTLQLGKLQLLVEFKQ